MKINTITGTENREIDDLLYGFDDRFQKLVEEIENNSTVNSKILDIGCGEGKIWQLFPGHNVTGLDISEKNLKKAKKYLKPVLGKAEELPFMSESFDLVIASEILEHLFRPEQALQEINRVLRQKGKAIITFPNTASLSFRISLLIWGRNPTLNYPDNSEHIRFFDLESIKKLLYNNTKLTIKKIRGGGFLSFSKVNFGVYIPIPRIIRVVGGDLFPKLARGYIIILEKNA